MPSGNVVCIYHLSNTYDIVRDCERWTEFIKHVHKQGSLGKLTAASGSCARSSNTPPPLFSAALHSLIIRSFAMKLSFSLFVAALAVTSEAHKLTVKKISRTGGPQRRTPGNSAADYQINVASASASGANAFDLKYVLTSLPQILTSH